MGKRSLGLSVVVVILLSLAGCLEDDATAIVRYDAKSDRFGVLTVYEHFRSRGPSSTPSTANRSGDVASLVELWQKRDRIVMVEPSLFGNPIYIELSADHKTRADPKDDEGEAKVSWERIKIVPGKMFRDTKGGLGYYHEMWIPGAVVDQLLQREWADSAGSADLLAAEHKRRAEGGARGSWKAVGQTVRAAQAAWLASFEKEEAVDDTNNVTTVEWIRCLDEESLAALQEVVAKRRFETNRAGQRVTLRVPLSESDAKELASLLSDVKNGYIEFAARKPPDGEKAYVALYRKLFKAVAGNVSLKTGTRGLEISVEAVDALNAFNAAMSEARAASYAKDPTLAAAAKQMAEEVGSKVVVSEGVDVGKEVADFKRKTGE